MHSRNGISTEIQFATNAIGDTCLLLWCSNSNTTTVYTFHTLNTNTLLTQGSVKDWQRSLENSIRMRMTKPLVIT